MFISPAFGEAMGLPGCGDGGAALCLPGVTTGDCHGGSTSGDSAPMLRGLLGGDAATRLGDCADLFGDGAGLRGETTARPGDILGDGSFGDRCLGDGCGDNDGEPWRSPISTKKSFLVSIAVSWPSRRCSRSSSLSLPCSALARSPRPSYVPRYPSWSFGTGLPSPSCRGALVGVFGRGLASSACRAVSTDFCGLLGGSSRAGGT